MHLAVVIDSAYEQNSRVLSLPAATADGFLVYDRLFRSDSGFVVERMDARRELPEQLEARLADLAEPLESLFVYFAGYVATRDGRSAAVLLDGERLRALPLPRLFELAERSAHNSLFLFDAAVLGEGDQTPSHIVEAIGKAVPYGGGINALFAARRMGMDSAYQPSRFTDLFLVALEWVAAHAADPTQITVTAVLEVMRAERASFALVEAASNRLGLTDFHLLPGRLSRPTSGVWQRDPEAIAPMLPPPPTPSWPPQSLPPAQSRAVELPLPSFDDGLKTSWQEPSAAPTQPAPAPSGSEHPVVMPAAPPVPSELGSPAAAAAPLVPSELGSPPAQMAPPLSPELASPPAPTAHEAPTARETDSAEALIRSADSLAAQGKPQAAAEQYESALAYLAPDNVVQRLRVQLRLAQTLEKLDKDAQALEYYSAAFVEAPHSRKALEGAVRILAKTQDDRGIERYVRAHLETSLDPEAKAQVLEEWATRWTSTDNEAQRADILQELVAVAPANIRVWRRLIEARDRLGDHAGAVDARCTLVDQLTEAPKEQVKLLSEAARIALEHLGARRRATQLARRALELSANALDALSVAAEALGKDKAWEDLAELYEATLVRLEDDQLVAELALRLGLLLKNRLSDPRRACPWLERAVTRQPKNLELREALTDVWQAVGDFEHAILHAREAVALAPRRIDLYVKLRVLFERAGLGRLARFATDAAFLVRGATMERTPDTLLSVARGLTERDWQEGLLFREREPAISALLGAIAPCAIAIRTHELKKSHALPTLSEQHRLDPDRSTATIARSLNWTARLLGMRAPRLYLIDRAPREMSAVPFAEPTTLVSRALGRGLTLPELSFLWGRHLSFLHPEHYLLVFYPTARELAALLLATLAVARMSPDQTDALDADTRRLTDLLEKTLDPSARKRVEQAAEAFSTKDARSRVFAWARSVERAGCRAGLLCCGNLFCAAELTRKFPLGGLLSEEEQVDDLLTFAVSDEHRELCERLGVDAEPRSQRAATVR